MALLGDSLSTPCFGAIAFDSIRKPTLYLGLYPPHGPRPDANPAGKPACRFELVDHRAPEACDLADLRQAQNLQTRCCRAGVVEHFFNRHMWMR